MAQQQFNDGDTGLVVRTIINANAMDAESRLAAIELFVPTAELSANKGVANGYAGLDGGAKVPVSQLPSSVIGGIKVIGFWDANTNTPDLSALTLEQGQAYMVSTGGNTNLNGETNWRAKDLATWDDSLAGNWFKQDNTDDVLSVAGKTGIVTLVSADITDFQAQVSANTDVAANTAARHAAVTLNADAKTQDALNLTGQELQIKKDVYDKANQTGVDQITGTISVFAPVAADQDDYGPAGFQTSNLVRINVTSDADFTGFVAPPAGVTRVIYIVNITTTGNKIKLIDNDAGSVAGNRMILPGNSDYDLNENGSAILIYDHTSARWRAVSIQE